ncbi:MAG TPA: family 16 glycoside hydrolase [Pedobacter sp.]|jgi:hypothetical protein
MTKKLSLFSRAAFSGLAWLCSTGLAIGQQPASETIMLNDLSAFKNPGKYRQMAGDVNTDLEKQNVFSISKGTGIIVNTFSEKNRPDDLVSNIQHGDVDLELDFIMAKGSNSGIYLQGRYEVQLLDSWTDKVTKAGGNGGIYERWDESKPHGQKAYEGYAPRINASKAPGLWQHIKISFQAPRFDNVGKKIENAKILRVELNGMVIHENVQLSGPTRGGYPDEAAFGPLRLQGDHGSVAFRNIKVINYNQPRPELLNLNYYVYKGKFEVDPDFSKLPPEAYGPATGITAANSPIGNEYLIRYTGTIRIKEAGNYYFNLSTKGGRGVLKINNQEVKAAANGPAELSSNKMANLAKGDFPFELTYSKYYSWSNSIMGLSISGLGLRPYYIGDEDLNGVADPIYVDANEDIVLRSFIDVPDWGTVVHAASVGSPDQVHYSYDLDRGCIFQLWRGGFVDATPMWHGRGEGSSRPRGAVQILTKPQFSVLRLSSPQNAWKTDTAGAGFRSKGYTLGQDGKPSFHYQIDGMNVTDIIRPSNNAQGLTREIVVQNASDGVFAKIAESKTIREVSKGRYVIGDKAYYLRLNDAGARPVLRESNGQTELLMPVNSKISYSIIF